jgi:hypothetical protein
MLQSSYVYGIQRAAPDKFPEQDKNLPCFNFRQVTINFNAGR